MSTQTERKISELSVSGENFHIFGQLDGIKDRKRRQLKEKSYKSEIFYERK